MLVVVPIQTENDPCGTACIWKANVPPKIRVFAWRLATDILPTRNNRVRRKLEFCSKCAICGAGDENAHHATVMCTKAAELRHALRVHWELPKEILFRHTGKD
jgi:hypothetical protein